MTTTEHSARLSDRLLDAGTDVWEAQKRHPSVRELAADTLDEAAFKTWVAQDYRYLLEYARVFAIAGAKATDEAVMTRLLDVAEHVADLASEEHRYAPFIEKYASDEFAESVDRTRELVDRCAEANPGKCDATRSAFLTSARLEYRFWEMAYTREGWEIPEVTP